MTGETIDRLLLGKLERCSSGRHARVPPAASAAQFRARAIFILILYLAADSPIVRWRASRRIGILVAIHELLCF
jgi:hypothetical protein